ncbi:MAG: head GIN domain-containing protein [Methylococcales bacterium]
MNIQIHYLDNRQKQSLLSSFRWGFLGITFACGIVYPAMAGQSVTGKIIIDGVVYGEGSFQVVKGSGVLGREHRTVGDFHEVVIHGGLDVDFTRDDDVSVSLSGDDNLLKVITTDVKLGVLHIGSKESYETKIPLLATLTAPSLSALEINGSGDVKLNDLKEKTLTLNLNGSGDVQADGSTDELSVRISGAGNMDAKQLTSDNAVIQIVGSGDMEVNVKDSLDVSIIGSGNVTYYGNPKSVEPKIIGSGDVEAGD